MDSSPVAFTHKHSASVLSLTLCGADRWRAASFRLRPPCIGWLGCRTTDRCVKMVIKGFMLLRSESGGRPADLRPDLWINSQSSASTVYYDFVVSIFASVEWVSQTYRNEISCEWSEQRRERLHDTFFFKGLIWTSRPRRSSSNIIALSTLT